MFTIILISICLFALLVGFMTVVVRAGLENLSGINKEVFETLRDMGNFHLMEIPQGLRDVLGIGSKNVWLVKEGFMSEFHGAKVVHGMMMSVSPTYQTNDDAIVIVPDTKSELLEMLSLVQGSGLGNISHFVYHELVHVSQFQRILNGGAKGLLQSFLFIIGYFIPYIIRPVELEAYFYQGVVKRRIPSLNIGTQAEQYCSVPCPEEWCC